MTYEEIKNKYLNEGANSLTNEEMGILIHGNGPKMQIKEHSDMQPNCAEIGIRDNLYGEDSVWKGNKRID